jgi:hypothetical protein
MSTRGLLGFRYQDIDKLTYNHADSHPDTLGLKVLKELHAVDDWDVVRQRIGGLHSIPETRKLDEHSSMAETEIRRHFPELEYRGAPRDFYDLYRPLQGMLKPYLEGKLMFMPDASDFIYDSLFCEWAYIANLDSNELEVWKGLQHKPDPESRYGQEADRMGCYPCTMLIGYHLDDLPDPVRFMADYKLYRDISNAGKRYS